MFVFSMRDANGRPVQAPRWASWLAMGFSVVLGLAALIVAASLALVLIPVLLIGGAIAAWRIRKMLKAARFAQEPFARPGAEPADRRIIDVEYRVIEPGER